MFCSCSRSWNCKGRRELPGKAGHIYEVVSSLSWRYFIKNKRGGRRESRKGWLISQLTRILSSMGQRLHIECSVPGATGSLEVQLDCAQFQKLRMVRGAVFKEAPSNSIYISGSCSVDAPSEPQWCCQWISCAHIPVSFVISSACFLLIKLAILLSPSGGWQTDRHTRHRAGGQEWQVGRVWWWQTGRRWRGVARVLEKVTAPQTPLFVWRSHS